MKELSIEEKAKAYDKAKYIMKEYLKSGNAGVIAENTIKKAFPELAESEDEKIRKWLICTLKSLNNSSVQIDGAYEMMLPAIAWLEKQDYTFEIKEGHWYKCVCDYMLNGSDLMFKNGRLYYCRSDWRLKGEIDERNVKDIGVNGYKSFFRPATNQEIKDWLEKQGEQKPDEWSEEDEKMLNDIIMCGERHCYLDAGNISWLKSLKNRVQPQNLTVTDEELAQAKKDAYNDALDKIEYHSGEPTFDDGWDAAIWYLKKRIEKFAQQAQKGEF